MGGKASKVAFVEGLVAVLEGLKVRVGVDVERDCATSKEQMFFVFPVSSVNASSTVTASSRHAAVLPRPSASGRPTNLSIALSQLHAVSNFSQNSEGLHHRDHGSTAVCRIKCEYYDFCTERHAEQYNECYGGAMVLTLCPTLPC